MDTTSIQDSLADLKDQVRPQIEHAKRRIVRLSGRMTNLVQDHPVACLLGALALGFLVARVARHQN